MINQCELALFSTGWAGSIPMREHHCHVFHAENCPIPPAIIKTEKLIITKNFHVYHPCFRVDSLEIFARKETLRSLGLLLLSTVFHSELQRIQVCLTNTLSDIKSLIIEPWSHFLSDEAPGYFTKPFSFNYWPKEVHTHPWLNQNITNPYEYPGFFLTNENDICSTEECFLRRDVLRGFGSNHGTILLAEFLLNISRNENSQDEFHLETEVGFRGVAPKSCQASIWLPGSFNWWGNIASALE